MSKSTNDDGFDRRTVLKSVAAGTAATAGASGLASAKSSSSDSLSTEAKREATADYRSIAAVESLFAEHSDLLDAAVDAGHLDEASVDAFDIEVDGMYSERGDVLGFNAKDIEGSVVPEVRVLHRLDSGAEIMFAIRPTHNAGYVNYFPDADASNIDRVYAKNWDFRAGVCGCTCSNCEESLCCPDCNSDEECVTLTSSCCCWDTCQNATCAEAVCRCKDSWC